MYVNNRKRACSESGLHSVIKKRRTPFNLANISSKNLPYPASNLGLNTSQDLPPGPTRSDVPVATREAPVSSLESRAQHSLCVAQYSDNPNSSVKATPFHKADLQSLLPENSTLRDWEHFLQLRSSHCHQRNPKRASLSDTDLQLGTKHLPRPFHLDKPPSRGWLTIPRSVVSADNKSPTEGTASNEGCVHQTIKRVSKSPPVDKSDLEYQSRPSSPKKSRQSSLTKATLKEHLRLSSASDVENPDSLTEGVLQEVRQYHF